MVPSYKGFRYSELTPKEGLSSSIHLWGDGDSHSVMVYDMPWNDYVAGAYSKIVGYSFLSNPAQLDVGGVKRLQRIIPLQHPIFPWLWATKIAQAQPIQFTGPTVGVADSYAAFSIMRLHILFQSLPYVVLSDRDLLDTDPFGRGQGHADESLRFVEKRSSVSLQTLEVPQGSLKYIAKPAGATWSTIQQRQYQRVMHRRLDWTWHKVAETYLMLTNTEKPKNLDACVGFVNLNSWQGYNPGTLLCIPYELEPEEAPTDPVNVGLPAGYPPRLWKVKLHLDYFEPPTDPGVVYPGTIAGYGWNLLPAPQLSTPYWYPASSDGTVGGTLLYQGVDFNKIFQTPN